MSLSKFVFVEVEGYPRNHENLATTNSNDSLRYSFKFFMSLAKNYYEVNKKFIYFTFLILEFFKILLKCYSFIEDSNSLKIAATIEFS